MRQLKLIHIFIWLNTCIVFSCCLKVFTHDMTEYMWLLQVGAIYGTAAFGSAIEDFPKYFNSCNPKTKGDSLKEVLMGKLTISLSVSVDSKQWVLGQFVYIDGFLNYWIS